jgi:cytochrome c nitrite reductase small subunit
MHDVYVFSTGTTPELIRLNENSREIVQANCIRCHTDAVETIMTGVQPFERRCWDCHRSTAHGDRGSSQAIYQDSSLYPLE